MLHLLAASDAGAASASGVLTEAMVQVIQGGLDSVVATVGQVIPLVVALSISLIALTAGINYALKKVRGVVSKAS